MTRPLLRIAVPLLLAAALAGCGGPSRMAAVPKDFTEQATVLGISDARYYADTQLPQLARGVLDAAARERAALGIGPSGRLPPANFLAVSGGSDDGAFGAGLLVGWSDAGTRPEFKLVTGVSTGALIAPFAFLGSTWDPQLRSVYTDIRPSDVYARRDWLSIPFADAMADTAPLFTLISRYADQAMLDAIAREYGKGRVLLIGTTNLDVQRPVIWNIGAIASSGHPGALDLVRRILLASAAVPALFPPVMIEVEYDGRRYQEMHVDGGAVAQSFLYPPTLARTLELQRRPELARERHAYIIRNARLDPDWASVDRRLLGIAGRAISTMIHYSGHNDILRMQTTTRQDGVDFNLAFIGADFTTPRREDFDQDYMRALFEYGYRRGREGYRWYKAHPVFEDRRGAAPQIAQPR